jgi:hypothetical protein
MADSELFHNLLNNVKHYQFVCINKKLDRAVVDYGSMPNFITISHLHEYYPEAAFQLEPLKRNHRPPMRFNSVIIGTCSLTIDLATFDHTPPSDVYPPFDHEDHDLLPHPVPHTYPLNEVPTCHVPQRFVVIDHLPRDRQLIVGIHTIRAAYEFRDKLSDHTPQDHT